MKLTEKQLRPGRIGHSTSNGVKRLHFGPLNHLVILLNFLKYRLSFLSFVDFEKLLTLKDSFRLTGNNISVGLKCLTSSVLKTVACRDEHYDIE